MKSRAEQKNKYAEAKRIIRNAQRNDKLVVFVGAGASIAAGLPSWKTAVSAIAEKLGMKESEVTPDSFLRIPQFYYNNRGKNEYTQLIHDIFKYGQYIQKNHIHDQIIKFNTKTIITTNYDHLIEKAAEDNGEMISVISKDSDFPYINSGRELIKMHGDFESDNFVLKEDDYLSYEQNFRLLENYIKSLIGTKVILFLGYSFNDPDVKHIFSWVKGILQEDFQQAYMIETHYDYDYNMETYLKNLGVNILFSSVQLEEDIIKSTGEAEKLERMLSWLQKNEKKSDLDELYDAIKISEELDYTYGKYIENAFNKVGFTIDSGRLSIEDTRMIDGEGKELSSVYIMRALAYAQFLKNPASVYMYRGGSKIPYSINERFRAKKSDAEQISAILDILKKSAIQELLFMIWDDENDPALKAKKSDNRRHLVYVRLDEIDIPDWYRAVLNFDEDSLKIIAERKSQSLNGSLPDLYIEQAHIYLSLGNYLGAYNCLKNASSAYYKMRNTVRYFIAETNRYNVGKIITNFSNVCGIDEKTIDLITEDIKSIDIDAIYRSLPDIGSGRYLLNDISDFKLSYKVFQDVYQIAMRVKEEAGINGLGDKIYPAYEKLRLCIMDLYRYESLNHIFLDIFCENTQVYRLYFESILASVTAIDKSICLNIGEYRLSNVHADNLTRQDIFFALKYEETDNLKSIMKNMPKIPIDDDALNYLKKLMKLCKNPEIGSDMECRRPFWKLVIILGYIRCDRELVNLCLDKLSQFTNGNLYDEYGEIINKLVNNFNHSDMIDEENIEYVHKLLKGLVKYCIESNQTEFSVIATLMRSLMQICNNNNCAFDEAELIHRMIESGSKELCIGTYDQLGKISQDVIQKKYKQGIEVTSPKDYMLYCFLVIQDIISPDKMIENKIFRFCADKEYAERLRADMGGVFLGIVYSEYLQNEKLLMIMMCNLYIRNLIIDKAMFFDTVNEMNIEMFKWLIDLDGYDYIEFELWWLEYCTDALLREIIKNKTATEKISRKIVEAHRRGRIEEKYLNLYFKYFAISIR